jgi:two-component system chemotaxis response regulator CheY
MHPKLNVLLVDDSRTVLRELEGILAEVDDLAVVGMANNGAAAIRMTGETRPDLVLLDIVMPGLDGLSALRTIRSLHPDIDVVMISSLAGDARKAAEARHLGAFDVLAKPFDQDMIESVVADVRAHREELAAASSAPNS